MQLLDLACFLTCGLQGIINSHLLVSAAFSFAVAKHSSLLKHCWGILTNHHTHTEAPFFKVTATDHMTLENEPIWNGLNSSFWLTCSEQSGSLMRWWLWGAAGRTWHTQCCYRHSSDFFHPLASLQFLLQSKDDRDGCEKL